MSASDRFGFLPINRTITFDDGVVEPLPSLAGDIARVRLVTHRDGYRYPPLRRDNALHVFEPLGEETERSAHLHQMPPSHVLRLDSALVETGSTFRLGDGAFLMHFLGLMFGYRLQFHEWWVDGRLPMFPRRWRLPPPLHLEGKLLSDAYFVWRDWPSSERTRFTNLLYMHVRSAIYEWDWERFTVNYMVFDGCYKMAETLKVKIPELTASAAKTDSELLKAISEGKKPMPSFGKSLKKDELDAVVQYAKNLASGKAAGGK